MGDVPLHRGPGGGGGGGGAPPPAAAPAPPPGVARCLHVILTAYLAARLKQEAEALLSALT